MNKKLVEETLDLALRLFKGRSYEIEQATSIPMLAEDIDETLADLRSGDVKTIRVWKLLLECNEALRSIPGITINDAGELMEAIRQACRTFLPAHPKPITEITSYTAAEVLAGLASGQSFPIETYRVLEEHVKKLREEAETAQKLRKEYEERLDGIIVYVSRYIQVSRGYARMINRATLASVLREINLFARGSDKPVYKEEELKRYLEYPPAFEEGEDKRDREELLSRLRALMEEAVQTLPGYAEIVSNEQGQITFSYCPDAKVAPPERGKERSRVLFTKIRDTAFRVLKAVAIDPESATGIDNYRESGSPYTALLSIYQTARFALRPEDDSRSTRYFEVEANAAQGMPTPGTKKRVEQPYPSGQSIYGFPVYVNPALKPGQLFFGNAVDPNQCFIMGGFSPDEDLKIVETGLTPVIAQTTEQAIAQIQTKRVPALQALGRLRAFVHYWMRPQYQAGLDVANGADAAVFNLYRSGAFEGENADYWGGKGLGVEFVRSITNPEDNPALEMNIATGDVRVCPGVYNALLAAQKSLQAVKDSVTKPHTAFNQHLIFQTLAAVERELATAKRVGGGKPVDTLNASMESVNTILDALQREAETGSYSDKATMGVRISILRGTCAQVYAERDRLLAQVKPEDSPDYVGYSPSDFTAKGATAAPEELTREQLTLLQVLQRMTSNVAPEDGATLEWMAKLRNYVKDNRKGVSRDVLLEAYRALDKAAGSKVAVEAAKTWYGSEDFYFIYRTLGAVERELRNTGGIPEEESLPPGRAILDAALRDMNVLEQPDERILSGYFPLGAVAAANSYIHTIRALTSSHFEKTDGDLKGALDGLAETVSTLEASLVDASVYEHATRLGLGYIALMLKDRYEEGDKASPIQVEATLEHVLGLCATLTGAPSYTALHESVSNFILDPEAKYTEERERAERARMLKAIAEMRSEVRAFRDFLFHPNLRGFLEGSVGERVEAFYATISRLAGARFDDDSAELFLAEYYSLKRQVALNQEALTRDRAVERQLRSTIASQGTDLARNKEDIDRLIKSAEERERQIAELTGNLTGAGAAGGRLREAVKVYSEVFSGLARFTYDIMTGKKQTAQGFTSNIPEITYGAALREIERLSRMAYATAHDELERSGLLDRYKLHVNVTIGGKAEAQIKTLLNYIKALVPQEEQATGGSHVEQKLREWVEPKPGEEDKADAGEQ